METKYRSYKELNWLMLDCFEAERRYYNSSEDIQEASLKRFLNHECVKRNSYANLIAEKLIQLGIEPKKYNTKKGNLHRNGLEEKKVLASPNWRALLNSCIVQDERCLRRYLYLLRAQELPKDILIMLSQQRKSITEALDRAVLFRKRAEVPLVKLDPKVRKLRAI